MNRRIELIPMKKVVSLFQVLLVCFSLLFISCGEKSQYPTKDFKPSVSEGRELYKMMAVDLDNDTIEEYLLLTNYVGEEKDEMEENFDFYNFDMLEIFAWSPKKNDYVAIFVDTLYFGTECDIMSFPKEKMVVIKTYSGGEDTILSSGMKLYAMRDKKVIVTFFNEVGMPTFVYNDSDSIPTIMVKGLISFDITEREPIEYIHSFYSYNNGIYELNTLKFKDQFLAENQKLSKEYYKILNGSHSTREGNKQELTALFIKMVSNLVTVYEDEETKKLFALEKKNIYDNDPEGYVEVVRYLYDNGFDYKSELDSLSSRTFSDAIKYKEQKRYFEAEKLFSKVLLIDYNFMDAYLELGELKLLQNKYQDALACYLQVATLMAENKRLYLGLIKSYIGINDNRLAISYGERYLVLDSVSSDALFVKEFLLKNSNKNK